MHKSQSSLIRSKIKSLRARANKVGSWRTLKEYSSFAYLGETPEKYIESINYYTKNKTLEACSLTTLVKGGLGWNTLSTQIKKDNKLIKIYDQKSIAWKKIKYIEKNCLNEIKRNFKMPEFELIEDNLIGLSKTDFIDDFEKSNEIEVAISKLNALGKAIKPTTETPTEFCDFRLNPVYFNRRKKIHLNIEKHKINHITNKDLDSAERNIQNLDKVFSHGDINPENYSYEGFIIDFDDFGFYPYGFDPAIAINKSKTTKETASILNNTNTSSPGFVFFNSIFSLSNQDITRESAIESVNNIVNIARQ